jgi:pyrimidine-nucleoside phosphorylase
LIKKHGEFRKEAGVLYTAELKEALDGLKDGEYMFTFANKDKNRAMNKLAYLHSVVLRTTAEKLAELMEKVGRSAGKKCKAVVTDMNSPLGKNIGNALEVKEAVEVLQGKVKGTLYDVCIELAADILELADKGSKEECIKLAENAISSGKALDILRETIKLHGGNEKICDDVTLLPQPLLKYEIRATKDMKILGFNCEELGMTSLLLGAGRLTQNDKIDMSAGIIMNCEIGDQLAADDVIMTLYSTVCSDFSDAAVRALNAVKFKITEKPSYT